MAQQSVSEDKVFGLAEVGDALVLDLHNLVSRLFDSHTFYMVVDNLVLLGDVHIVAHAFLVSLGLHGVDIYAQDGTLLQAHNNQELACMV